MKFPGKMTAEVLRHVAKAPATILYPFVKVQMPKDFRGKMIYFAEKCNGCKLCMKDCPSNALTINKLPDKRCEAIFDLDRCIYCGQCVDSCNRDAIQWTGEFELAALSRKTLRVTFEAVPALQPAVAAPAAELPTNTAAPAAINAPSEIKDPAKPV